MNAAALGSTALWGAVAAGALASLSPPNRRLIRSALGVSGALALISTLVLVGALLAGDFSIAYVAETTSRATPWPYRLGALWGGMDGSMLFYTTLTVLVGFFAVGRDRSADLALRVVALVGLGYLLITAVATNPFETLAIPVVDGEGLLGILQHPAMIYHPPILYLGLTTLVVPFALTIPAIATGQTGTRWLQVTRRWLFVSWTLLTFGMVAGANWAYVELGWGGFWAWDPVENTALMPWLAATVFIHTSRIQQRYGRLRRWNTLFALLPFALTILGVYLTRSGVTGSIHSFAEDPVIGRTLLTGAIIALLVSAVAALKAPHGDRWGELGAARDSWLAVGGGLISAALVFVTIGTAYPAYARVFFDEAVTVDSRFFTTTVYPIAVGAGILTAFALETRWTQFGVRLRRLALWLVSSAVVGLIVMLWFESTPAVPLLLVAVGGAGSISLARRIIGRGVTGRALVAHLAHLGLLMVLLGAGGSALGDEFRGVMSPGDTIEVGGRELSLAEVEVGEEDRYIYVRARFDVDGESTLEPEIRAYEDQARPISEPDIVSSPAVDLIVAVSRLSRDGQTVSVSVFARPMVWWVWAGALTMGLAGLGGLYWRSGVVEGQRRLAIESTRRAGTTSGSSAG